MTILLMRLGPIARTSAMRSDPISNVPEPRPRLYTHAFDARIEVVVITRYLSIRAALRRCH